jgi:hypothetical protein
VFKNVKPGMVLRQEHDDSRTIYVLRKDKKNAYIFFLAYNRQDGYWLYRETVPRKKWNEWNMIYSNTIDCTDWKLHQQLIARIFARDFDVRSVEV